MSSAAMPVAVPVQSPPAARVLITSHVQFPAVDLAVVDSWLAQGFEIAVEEVPVATGVDAGDPFVALLARGLLLAREFLQLGRIPVFAPPQIMAVEPAEPARKVTVTLPAVEFVARRAYEISFNAALQLVAQLGRMQPSPATLANVHQAVIKKVLEPLRSLVPAGESGMHVLRAAHRVGIPFAHLGGDVFLLGWGCHSTRLDRSAGPADSALGSRTCRHKFLATGVLARAGLPTPAHYLVGDRDTAVAAARRLVHPVVVKPVDMDRGEGVTTDLRTDDAVGEAFSRAVAISPSRQVLVERQVPGVCHRLFIANGRLLYAVQRLPHSVEGDGLHTVAQLVELANRRESLRPPWKREKPYPLDTLAVQSILGAGHAVSSIPAAGQWVPLRPIETTAWGGHDEDVTTTLHPENVRIAIKAAEAFALNVAGIDIISPDITRPWHENGAVVNEVNFAPLLGGGDISRSHLAEFLADSVPHGGRIPIEVFVGGEAAVEAARRRQAERTAAGQPAFFTSGDRTLTPEGVEEAMAFTGAHSRCQALLMDRRVAGLVVAMSAAEYASGLPVDRVDGVHVVDAGG